MSPDQAVSYAEQVVSTILPWVRQVSPDTEQERNQKEFSHSLHAPFSGDITADHAGRSGEHQGWPWSREKEGTVGKHLYFGFHRKKRAGRGKPL